MQKKVDLLKCLLWSLWVLLVIPSMFTSVIYVASNALYETTKEDIFLAQKDVFKAFPLLTSLACCVTIFVPLVALSDSALENYKVIKEE